MHVQALFIATGLGLDAHGLVVWDILQGLAGIGGNFLYLVEVNLAIGVDGGLAIGLAVEHVLIDMGI